MVTSNLIGVDVGYITFKIHKIAFKILKIAIQATPIFVTVRLLDLLLCAIHICHCIVRAKCISNEINIRNKYSWPRCSKY